MAQNTEGETRVIPPPPRQVDPDDNTKLNQAEQDPIDPESAHDPKTGQNLHWDCIKKTWVDSKTGKSMGFQGGTASDGEVIPPPPRQVDPNDGTKLNQAEQDPINPESAHDPKTGQNLHWDRKDKTWKDSKTGKAMGLKGATTKKKCPETTVTSVGDESKTTPKPVKTVSSTIKKVAIVVVVGCLVATAIAVPVAVCCAQHHHHSSPMVPIASSPTPVTPLPHMPADLPTPSFP